MTAEELKRLRELDERNWSEDFQRRQHRADVIAEIMANYRSKGKSLLEIEAPRLTEILTRLGRSPDREGLREVQDIGADLIKLIEKK